MKKILRTIGLGLIIALLLGVFGFLVWASTPARPEAAAIESLASARVDEDHNWLVFTPGDADSAAGLVLYPGGRVDYRAYAPHAKAVAEGGFTVVIVPMPLNFAFLGVNRAADVIADFPEIETWAVGGHSLGGAMAAEFSKSNPSLVDGLVLWASYPADNTDFSDSELPVLSIFGSNDQVASLEEIEDSRNRLPEETQYIQIDGGNHAGFGWYGVQNGDGSLEISKADQQNQIAAATKNFLQNLGQD
jgi:pimeloyl-ACP methyl ester carboxylesterase